MVTDTQQIVKNGNVLTITMTDNTTFSIDLTEMPMVPRDAMGNPMTLTEAHQNCCDVACRAMKVIKF